jgi:hypothetical protein
MAVKTRLGIARPFSGRGDCPHWVEDCWNDKFDVVPTDGSAWTATPPA